MSAAADRLGIDFLMRFLGYTIRQKISNACYADSIQGQILVQATGMQELSAEGFSDFYPNPVDRTAGIIRFKYVQQIF